MKRVMKKLPYILFTLIVHCFFITPVSSQEIVSDDSVKIKTPEKFKQREYPLTLSYQPDIRIAGNNGIALNRLTEDAFINYLAPHLSGVFGEIIGGTWNFFFNHFYTLWPHEFGHWMRAEEIGVKFTFHDFNPILPHTTVDIPDGRTLTDEESALVSVAGFEVNSYIARRGELEFYTNGFAYSSDLTHAWINEIFFPVYAFLVFPIDPEEPSIWQKTKGDPVHFILPVYERFTGRSAIDTNGNVDSKLVSLYETATLLSLIVPLTDPFFYQAVIENFSTKSYKTLRPVTPWILLGNRDLGWTYGTHFNPSPLGYEIYFTNYLFIQKKLIALSLKWGAPFLNQSIGIRLPGIFRSKGFSLSPYIEVWDQSFSGVGAGIGSEFRFKFSANGPELWTDLGYKTEGYSLALPLQRGLHALFGLTLYFTPTHVEM